MADAIHLKGRPAAPGFAAGPLQVLTRAPEAPRSKGSVEEEAEALRSAVASAIGDLEILESRLTAEAAALIEFQIAMLDDPALSEAAFEAVAGGVPAAAAWTAAMETEIAGYRSGNDEYFRARATDLADIRDRVLALLVGGGVPQIRSGAIVIATDLTPSQFLATDWQGGGIALVEGSPTSHVAMLARARGVPMLVGLEKAEAAQRFGAPALLDGGRGVLVIDPDPDMRADLEHRRSVRASGLKAGQAALTQPARMADGTRVSVMLNIGDPAELDALDPAICDGIGLVRTELLFAGAALPDEEAQYAVYARIVRWAAGRPVTIRTLDAGGDKPISGITVEGERNPFLGIRGIRLSLRHPALFKVQLRALARAAADGPIEIMLPMVSIPAEIEAASRILDEACQELGREGLVHRRPALGIMVEVPAVAVTPERFDAAFYSIGSNDLVQYTLAAGRDVAALADLATPADASVLKLIAIVAAHGGRSTRKVSLCGDAGGDPAIIPHLLDAGLRILSMSAADVSAAKRAIAAHSPRTTS